MEKPAKDLTLAGFILFLCVSILQDTYMKGVLNYIWKNRLLPKSGLHTTDGEELCIISYGEEDKVENIFHNVRVRIGGQEWYGDVAIHENLQEEKKPESTTSPSTDGMTVLHVTDGNGTLTETAPGTSSRLSLKLPESLAKEFENAIRHSQCIPCHESLKSIGGINMNSYLSRLLIERIEEKAENILQTFSECSGLWDDTLLKTIIRSFGFGIQGDIFEKWAKVLNMNALGKHRDNLLQVEAIMFGQAGLLEEESIPHYYRSQALDSGYYREIVREFRFLKNKFNLNSIGFHEWGNGSATPHVRIARIAALYSTKRIGFSSMAACDTISSHYTLLDTTLEGYWSNHTCLGGTETCGNGGMKQRQLDIIVINAVVPLLYIYGKHRNDTASSGKAEELLHHLKSEENSIIKKWLGKGLEISCAADSQAILQLEKKYCRMRNCIGCRFAYHYIKERIAGIETR